jgi:hypothetical protein
MGLLQCSHSRILGEGITAYDSVPVTLSKARATEYQLLSVINSHHIGMLAH